MHIMVTTCRWNGATVPRGIPYSSKFSWYNIFVNFVIEVTIMKILFTKYLRTRIRAFQPRAITKFIFMKIFF